MRKTVIAALVALVLPAAASAQKWEGLADTPQMGWNSWNKFEDKINEKLIRETADAMVEKGLLEAGYIYLNLDDLWHGERDEQGFIHEDPEKFPSGMKALGDYIHSKGLKFGIYSDGGTMTCGCEPGSFGHEYQDAYTYASWGVDYLKYDWCNHRDINPKGAYRLMRDALRASGRPIFFSMCEWGSNKPWLWAEDIGHSWRTTGDIGCSFVDPIHHYDENGKYVWTKLSVLNILDRNEPLRQYAGPGHWNDPDMLEVGNGMSVNEDRAHFTLWCLMAAPLLLGNDLTTMTDETLAIITNKAVIALDQDRLGVQGLRFRRNGDIEYWFKPLQNGDWAFCILNRGSEDVKVKVNWKDFCFTDSISGMSTDFDKLVYKGVNLWDTAAAAISTSSDLDVDVPSHDVKLYRLSAVK